MIQSTSIEAYDSIKAKLGNRQYEVYKCLKSIEPACNKAIANELGIPINEITPRISELRYKGVVEQAFKADYEGRTVIFWQIKAPKEIKQINESYAAVSWLEKGEKI